MAYKVNYEIAADILECLPQNKRNVLVRCLERNLYLTSSYVMEHGELEVYKEGFYLILYGTRCKFTVFVEDNDGELKVLARKPQATKLHHLYTDSLHFGEADFENF